MNVEDFISPHLREMQPYTPIVPFDVLTKRLGLTREQIVKLDANENPYGPSPQALAALREADTLHIYPDPDQAALREAISRFIDVPAPHILCGSGVDEVIDIIGRAFIRPGETIVDLPPTFGMYRFEADIVDAAYMPVPRRIDYSLDVDAICARVRATPNAKLLFVANPNNPDGSCSSDADLLRLLDLPLMVILDEAYIDFSSQPSHVGWVPQHDNLIVLRTFSKLAGLAGLRVGYGVFPLAVIKHLWKIKQPYTPNIAGSLAAIAALSDPDYLRHIVQLIVAERGRLCELLSMFPGVQVYPSQSNFLLFHLDEREWPMSAKQIRLALEQRGILIRYFDRDGLRDCLRVSVGRPSETDRFIAALVDVRH
jgi:histidinol-phosphate aminotransferase